MKMKILVLCWITLITWPRDSRAQAVFVDPSIDTSHLSFNNSETGPESIRTNENYYDGDFADFDGDGWPDRALGARYQLLKNQGPYQGDAVYMTPYLHYANVPEHHPGAYGQDAFQWVDIDNDGFYDMVAVGNGPEGTHIQLNMDGYFYYDWDDGAELGPTFGQFSVASTDYNMDGYVDLFIHGGNLNLLGNLGPSYQFAIEDARVTGGTPTARDVVTGDLDNDGDFDLLISSESFG